MFLRIERRLPSSSGMAAYWRSSSDPGGTTVCVYGTPNRLVKEIVHILGQLRFKGNQTLPLERVVREGCVHTQALRTPSTKNAKHSARKALSTLSSKHNVVQCAAVIGDTHRTVPGIRCTNASWCQRCR